MTAHTVNCHPEKVFADYEPEVVAPLVRQLARTRYLIVLGRNMVPECAALEVG